MVRESYSNINLDEIFPPLIIYFIKDGADFKEPFEELGLKKIDISKYEQRYVDKTTKECDERKLKFSQDDFDEIAFEELISDLSQIMLKDDKVIKFMFSLQGDPIENLK